MNLSQLRYICEIARQKLNVSSAAKALHTSQPGMSRQVRQLENELKVEIFTRASNRLTGITPRGREIIRLAETILEDVASIKAVGSDAAVQRHGTLTIGITHTQARYALADVFKAFVAKYPSIKLSLQHGTPEQIDQLVRSGEADLGITTTGDTADRSVVALPCRKFERVIVVPRGHPLMKVTRPKLSALAKYPMVTYEAGFTGRSAVMNAFEKAGIPLNIAISASDADVIKNCVEQGLGVAVLSEAAIDGRRDSQLQSIPAGHLFEGSVSFVLLQRHRYLKPHEYEFIKMCSTRWTRANIERFVALRGGQAGRRAV